jgi:hypothetical protein
MSAAASPAPTGSVILVRIVDVLRDVARGGLAAIFAGIVVLGLGGRVVMRIAAAVNPDATGLRTEAGEVVGAVTAEGSLALLVFGGLVSGVVAGVVWVVASPWIPWTGPRRWLLAMPVSVALGGSFLVQSGNPDFDILGPDLPIVVMLLGLVALLGAAVAWLDERLERRLPRPGANRIVLLLIYGAIAGLGFLAVLLALSFYFSTGGFGGVSPGLAGWALIVVGAATMTWWAARIARGRPDRPPALLAVGRIGLVAAVLLGFAHLGPEVAKIVAGS